MAGPLTIHALKAVPAAGGVGGSNKQLLVMIADLFASTSHYQRVASNWGLSPTTSSFVGAGEKAFGVWRMLSGSEPHDIFCSFGYGNYTSTQYDTESVWSVCGYNYGFNIGVAWHSSGQAWAGTTNNNGADTITGGALWKSNSVAFPYANSNRANLLPVQSGSAFVYHGAETLRFSGYTDYDSFGIFISSSGNGNGAGVAFVFDKFTPVTASYDLPYFAYSAGVDRSFTTTDAFSINGSGLSLKKSDGVIPSASTGVGNCYALGLNYSTLATNPLFFTASIRGQFVDEFPLLVFSTKGEHKIVGYSNNIRVTNGKYNGSTMLGSGSRFVLTDTSYPDLKVTMPLTSSLITSIAAVAGAGLVNTSSLRFATGSNPGSLSYGFTPASFPLSVFTTTASGSAPSTDLWRYFLGGNYLFSVTYPVGQTDIVKVR